MSGFKKDAATIAEEKLDARVIEAVSPYDRLVPSQILKNVPKNFLFFCLTFFRVEISHVAKLLDMSEFDTLKKLQTMILDGKLSGTLNQSVGVLDLFEKPAEGVRGT
jgi:hypothetical protein